MSENKSNESNEDLSNVENIGAASEGAKATEKVEDGPSPEAEVERLKSEFLYLRAEFDNYRKQAIKERSEMSRYGAERLIVNLLDVLDNFDRALATELTPENLQSFHEGVQMTAKELAGVLKDHGVTESNPEGEPFDPMMHEALSSEETTEMEPGHIAKVFRKAYKLHDKVIRPAQVVVARTPDKNSD